MPTFNDARVRLLNGQPVNSKGRYVLYWCQMSRRLTHNHALDFAIATANNLNVPLVVYEGLKRNYPWANARIHQFMLEGMRDNAAAANRMGLNYWPFVETPNDPGRGLVRKILADARVLVTDDYPAFIVPAHNRAIAAVAECPVYAIDGDGMVPFSLLGPAVGAAAHLRPRLHKLFGEAWGHRATAEPVIPKGAIDPPFTPWAVPKDLAAFVKSLPLDPSVTPVTQVGGPAAGLSVIETFVNDKLPKYGTGRNHPDDPAKSSASGLSPYLHFGHVGIQQVCKAVLGKNWTVKEINAKTRNKDDFFCRDASVNGFLDEAITWRDLGFHWHHRRNADYGMRNAESKAKSWEAASGKSSFNFESMDFSPLRKGTLDTVLPPWALKTLTEHAADRREHLYSLEQFEAADTHDDLWNAAQTELVKTGKIHNYLRMLWGKKVLEWTGTPEEGYRVLEHLNNTYAIDGRDPNSYTGILWCFGLFDRPWPPERTVFGNIRYMSSDNTAKKFKLAGYYEYVNRLRGRAKGSLFADANE